MIHVLGTTVVDEFDLHGSKNYNMGGVFFVHDALSKALDKRFTKYSNLKPELDAYERPSIDKKNRDNIKIPIVNWELNSFGVEEKSVYRPLNYPRAALEVDHENKEPYEPDALATSADFFLVEDLYLDKGRKFDKEKGRKYKEMRSEWSKKISNKINDVDASDFSPVFLYMINRNIPSSDDPLFSEILIRSRLGWKNRGIILIYADTLRWRGLKISKQISWERTAQDYVLALHRDPWLKKLGDANHVITRFGVSGAIYSYWLPVGNDYDNPDSDRTSSRGRRVHRLFFSTTTKDAGIFRDAEKEGDMVGSQTIFASSIVSEIFYHLRQGSGEGTDYANRNPHGICEAIGVGIEKAILRTQKHFIKGFGRDPDSVKNFIENDNCVSSEIFNGNLNYNDNFVASERIPIGSNYWSILNQASEYGVLEIAESIVLHGVDNTLNCNKKINDIGRPVAAPILKIEEKNDDPNPLVIIDRRELESYRAVRKMLYAAVKGKTEKKPLSIAVFGPPGSGKTFIIKKLIRNVGVKEGDFEIINIAQLENAKSLEVKINETELKPSPRVLFFDEFDSEFEKNSLGWLKIFLMIMDDYSIKRKELLNERAKSNDGLGGNDIYIFAGGTSNTYEDFSREEQSVSETERARFKELKGPDFVSRLRGHINILGPNPINEWDQAYMIRRAVIMRSILLEKINKEIIQNNIGREFIRGLLRVSSFKHGSRSLEAIISMSSRIGGDEKGRYVSSALPEFPQLNMHVNSQELLAEIQKARFEIDLEDSNFRT